MNWKKYKVISFEELIERYDDVENTVNAAFIPLCGKIVNAMPSSLYANEALYRIKECKSLFIRSSMLKPLGKEYICSWLTEEEVTDE